VGTSYGAALSYLVEQTFEFAWRWPVGILMIYVGIACAGGLIGLLGDYHDRPTRDHEPYAPDRWFALSLLVVLFVFLQSIVNMWQIRE
jgi:hypothetical protein